jgi:NAD(P)-dependent dehydrogenase (short-subunit alcohol dehydrogenase family)
MAERPPRTLRDLGDLTGRRALVAGGAGHLGRAAVEALTEAGATVAVLDVASSEEAEVVVSCDLADEVGTRAGVREARERLGGLDVIVHAAALVGTSEREGWAVPFAEQTVAAWDAALGVNVTSLFTLVQEARDALVASGHGSVIAFGSIYGLVGPDPSLYDGTGLSNPTAYGVSKGGVLQLVRYLAATLAPHVRVNAVSPGGIERDQPHEFVERYRARTPLARMGTEEDIKGAVAFLASDLSAYVTGHNLVVDGGWTAW